MIIEQLESQLDEKRKLNKTLDSKVKTITKNVQMFVESLNSD